MALGSWILTSFGSASPVLESGPRGRREVIDVWDTDVGLPRNSVTAIVRTRDGYLWFGTPNGLVRFDGLRFRVFDALSTPGLSDSHVVSLLEDRAGNLWIGTETGGVALFGDGVFTSIGIGQGSTARRLVASVQDATGAVWLYTADGQLWRHANSQFSPFVFGFDRPTARRSIIVDTAGRVWAGTDGRVASIRPATGAGHLESQIDEEVAVGRLDALVARAAGGYWRLGDGRVQQFEGTRCTVDLGAYPWGAVPVACACEDRQGDLLVGTLGAGVYRFEGGGRVRRHSTSDGLSNNYIFSLCVDSDGSLWVGTDGGGLNRIRPQAFEAIDVSPDLGVGVVQTVCTDAKGGLWVGSNGGGLAYYLGSERRRYGPEQGLTHLSVWSVLVDRAGDVWVGTQGGGLFQLREGRLLRVGGDAIPRLVAALHEDRQGRLWVGTTGGLARRDPDGWRLFTTRDGLSNDDVRAIVDDGAEGLWIGTRGGGLNRWSQGRFTAWHRQDGAPGEDVSSLWLDRDGVLWVGTLGNGLGRFENGAWTLYTTREGLASNVIGYQLEDDENCLWLGSNTGLMRVARRDLNAFARGGTGLVDVRTYGKPDGMPTRECTMGSQPGAWRADDGTLWFSTVRGLTGIHLGRLRVNPRPPPVVIEAVLIDGQPQGTSSIESRWPERVVVPAGREHLVIQYTSINLVAPDKGRFRYRMEGHESAWTEAGNIRVARYSRLPPGEYRFCVTASNEDGIWNEVGASFAVSVETPLWQTPWFLGASASLLLGAIVGLVYLISTQRLKRQVERLEQKEALERERARIARDIHDQLGASLTQVALLGELVEGDKADPVEVEAHARQISQTARDTTRVLDEIVWAVNPSNDTLDGLMTYVSKYAQEYLSLAGVRCRLDVPAELPACALPPDARHNLFLAVKEAVTNVVRHAHASAVWIRLKLGADSYVIEIEDNGRGFAVEDTAHASSRNGLRNMRQRLEDVGGRFEISPAPEGGTVVRLTAPLGRG
ncbi:MAG: ATP-binding protein [Verrucomicrobia bacterium]|nr:ATP-binding protein [Verrucomicrobiota bacterium]MDI9381187.1 two-component regulator propeller domain-containing protein [Verrucomicrobiota bacterium]HOA61736.1 two-component regulator propeller domain-containing protein [Verrucomicrobiota bacterium]HOF49284.1 two-component regulator propeller domain-containing protein [Verrucomicrobiota bacterium]HOG87831.1 two-component regulator propeller domain-containing protein [Verrucomicrobiota bacterium]